MTELTDLARKLITEGANLATISTLMPDGSPQASIVWIDSDGSHILINTAEGRLKTNNFLRDPRVAVTVFNAESPAEHVLIRGRVVEVTRDGAAEHIDRLAKKYMGVDRYPYHRDDEHRIIVKIAPDRISG